MLFSLTGMLFRLTNLLFRLTGVLSRLTGVLFRLTGVLFRQTNVLFGLTRMSRMTPMTRERCEPCEREIPYPNIKANRKLPKLTLG